MNLKVTVVFGVVLGEIETLAYPKAAFKSILR